MPQGNNQQGDRTQGRTMHFNDGTHPDFQIPTTSEIEKMNNEKLQECGQLIAYGLTHGSGANVKLAFPFAYLIAKLVENGEKNPINLVRQFEQEGASARLGTVTINW